MTEKFTDYLLLTRAGQVFLAQGDHGLELPYVRFYERHFWQAVDAIIPAATASLGVEINVLLCLGLQHSPQQDELRAYYALELAHPGQEPAREGAWLGTEQVSCIPNCEQRALVAQWFAFAQADPVHPARAPWYNPGWSQLARKWIAAQLEDLQIKVTGSPVPLRSWQRAAIWRVPARPTPIYFKAVPAMFGFEPHLAQQLADWFPQNFPRVMSIHPQQPWFLMESLGSETLSESQDLETWQAAIKTFAELQVQLADQTGALLRLGVPDRRLEHFPGWIDALLDDTATLQRGEAGLADAEIAQLESMRPHLKKLSQQLAGSGIPASLEHGDFWTGQVLLKQTDYAFIDWSDSSISHPFLSLWFFLVELTYELPGVVDAYPALRRAYLEPWNDFMPEQALIETFELAQLLAPIHHALIYQRLILPNLEQQWEMANMLPLSLRRLLGHI